MEVDPTLSIGEVLNDMAAYPARRFVISSDLYERIQVEVPAAEPRPVLAMLPEIEFVVSKFMPTGQHWFPLHDLRMNFVLPPISFNAVSGGESAINKFKAIDGFKR